MWVIKQITGNKTMVSYQIVSKNVVRNTVKNHCDTSIVRVPKNWLHKLVEVRIVEEKQSSPNGETKPQ